MSLFRYFQEFWRCFLSKGVSLLALSSLISRLLGVWRDHLLAVRFGASSGIGIFDLDVYYAAFRLPDFLYNLLVFGTVSAVFVPIFSELLDTGDKKRAWDFAAIVCNVMCLVMFVITLLFFIAAPWIVPFLVPGFSSERVELAVHLTRLMLVSPLLFGLSGLAQSIANVFHKFLFYSLAPILYNLGIIGGVLFLSEHYGVYGVSIGVISGAFLHMVSQLPIAFKLGFRFRWLWDVGRFEVKKLGRLVLPRLFGGAIGPLSMMLDNFVASFLPIGAITVYNYAYNLQSLPMGVIGLSYAVVSFGVLSQLAVYEDKQEFISKLQEVIDRVLFLLVPASLGLFLLRHEITSLILFGGKFTEYDLIMTSRLLGIFCFGVVFQGVLPVLVRGFYALQNTFIPLVLGLVSLGISFCISFFGAVFLDFGVYAIALGSVIAVFFQTAAFFHLLSLQIKKRCNFINLNTFSNMLIATLIMSFVVIYIRDLFSTGVDFVYRVLQIALASGIGAGIYFAIVSYLSRKNCIKKLFKR